MKYIMLLCAFVTSVNMLTAMNRDKKLTITNKHSDFVIIKYEPWLPDKVYQNSKNQPATTTYQATTTVLPSDNPTEIGPFLTPCIHIKIRGFISAKNVPIVKNNAVIFIGAAKNNQINIISGQDILATLTALIHAKETIQQHKPPDPTEALCAQQ